MADSEPLARSQGAEPASVDAAIWLAAKVAIDAKDKRRVRALLDLLDGSAAPGAEIVNLNVERAKRR